MEQASGVTEYLNSFTGINGIIKLRYSDFLVNEISLDGNIVHLTDTSYEEKPEFTEDAENVFTNEHLTRFKELSESSKGSSEQIIIEANNEKLERTKMHTYIKKYFPKLSSETTLINDVRCIVVSFGGSKRDSARTHFKDYCKFVLYKENKSTMEAIEYMSSMLKVSHSLFSFAGTKDKRAITTQEVTAHRIHPQRLVGLNKCLKNVLLGNFKSCKIPLKLGDLKGNHFQIIIRNLDEDKCVDSSLLSLKQNGFINYFGMQRFGVTEICNSLIGKYIIKSDWVMAIELILKPRNEENELVANCRKIWDETHDPSKALEALKNYSCVERKLLEGLCKFSQRNAVAALSLIPRNMRLMYLHAYQSLIWNKIVSRRLKEFKAKVIVGDLFQTTEEKSVSLVTNENIGEVKLTDVVLPLPGFDVKYPDNEVRMWYDELLALDEIDVNCFKHKIRDYSLSGSYRKIIVVPDICRWEILHYQNSEDSLLPTDKNILEGCSAFDEKDGPYRALKLELSLPTSSYATMAIREITKQDTSSVNQTILTKNMKDLNNTNLS